MKKFIELLIACSTISVLCCCTSVDNYLPLITENVNLERFDRASNLKNDQKIVFDGKSITCSVPDDRAKKFIQSLNERISNDPSVFKTPGGAMLKLWNAIQADGAEVIVVGGSGGTGVSNETWLVNQKTTAMRSGPVLKKGRKECALARLSSGDIFVSGGIGERSMLNDCEVLDLKKGVIVSFAKMETPRCEHAVFEGIAGDIYAVGGKNSNFELLSSIEKFDMSKNRSYTIGRMNEARSSPRIFSTGAKKILIVGGSTDDLHHMPRPEAFQTN